MRSPLSRGPLPRPGRRPLVPFLLAALLLSPLSVRALEPPPAAGTSGSLEGMILGEDQRPAELVEVRIPSLRRGTRSDARGRFRLDGLPPGEYRVEAALMGHEPVQSTIRVTAGEVVHLELRLGGGRAVKTLEEYVVYGKKNEVRADQIGTRHRTERDKITDYRPESIADVASQAAGVVNTGGEIHLRGGRAEELKVQINGIEAFDVLGSRNAQVAVGAVSSVELVAGGVNPEHGNALSGVLDVVTREGGPRFGGDVRWDTDRYGDPTKTFDRYDRLSLAMGGPLAMRGLTWFATYEGTYQDGYLRSNQSQPRRTVLDFIQLGDRRDNRINTQWKLVWGAGPSHKLVLEGIANHSRTTPYLHSWSRKGFVQVFHDSGSSGPRFGSWSSLALDSTYAPMNLADHVPTQDDRFRQYLLSWRYVPDKSWLITNRVAATAFDTHQDVGGREPWEYEVQAPFFWNGNLSDDTEGSPYFATHGDFPSYADAHSRVWNWKGDVTTEAWRHHRIKSGLDLQWHSVRNLGLTFPNGESAGLPGTVRSDFRNDYPQAGMFLHDLWHFEGLVLSSGLRFDVFSPGQQVAMRDLPSGQRFKHLLSPRLGVSYPVSDRDALSFHYGWTFQTVSSAALFENRGIGSSVATQGNPDLEPETDVSYQAALQHLFAKDLYGQFSVFFRDIYGLLTVRPARDEAGNQISVWANGDYASARGFELSLARGFAHHFSADVAYTYSVATGVASDPNQAQQFVNGGTLYLPISERALRWDQRHTVSLQSTVRYPGRWGMHLQWSYGSGLPFTPQFRNDRRRDPLLENSRRLPSTSRLSLSGDRYVRLWGQDLTLFADARNLLDARNLTALSWADGINPNVNLAGGDDYTIYYTETGRVGGAYLKDVNGDHELDWVPVHDPRVFEEGRSVRMGLAMRF